MSRRGVTMIELIIVLAIIAITATLFVPGIGNQIQRQRLRTAAREMANYVQETRIEAIKNADFTNPRPYRVVFNTSQRSYHRQKFEGGTWSDDGGSKTLPTTVTIAQIVPADANSRYFKSDGSQVLDVDADPTNDLFDATPVTLKIQLRNGKGDRYQVTLYPLSGMTEVQEGWL